MRQKIRRILIFIALLLFPVTLNYLSPYVSINAAFDGLIAGSVVVFALQFLSGLFLGRAWCAWLCPVAGLSELCATVNNKPVHVKRLAVIRYTIFGVWFGILIAAFVLAGGVRGADPLYMTENIVSVDEPARFIIYYFVLGLLFVLTLTIGRRGACHCICWMAPFMTAGELVGRALRLPQLSIRSVPADCIDCGRCTGKCPMSIDVANEIKSGGVGSLACIRCGECVDCCPKHALRFELKPRLNSGARAGLDRPL